MAPHRFPRRTLDRPAKRTAAHRPVLLLTTGLALCVGHAAYGKKQTADNNANPAYATVPVSTEPRDPSLPAQSAGFNHPGVLVNSAQLAEIKRRVAAGIEPQKSAFKAMLESPLAAKKYLPKPRFQVECGSFSNPDLGCKDEQADSLAAYTQALCWIVTGDKAYARNAIEIMDAWSGTLRSGHTNNNGPVQAAWCAELWPRAAEIIRFTSDEWTPGEIARFQNMLRSQYLPSIIHGCTENGNKELSMSEALVNVGVFIDDRAVFDLGVKMWRGRTPAYIYLKSDGPKPRDPVGCDAIWSNKGHTPQLVDGLLQETARDSQHANLAFASMVAAAETARQQGVDLYSEQGARIMAAMEFQAQYLAPNSRPAPALLEFNPHPTWEIAYNHFHDRMGQTLPLMAAVLAKIRPTGTNHMMAWETLTHAGMGSIGLPPIAAAASGSP